tara:strand:- start:7844 stop:8353 length:510 start_codon:yes stop_codon:yes gene_type:complete
MSAYKIKRWTAVTSDNILKRPMFYIEPDEAFLSFVRANKFAVLCEISGTGMDYDHKPGSSVLIPGIVNRSAVVPNSRPNYYAKTGYYTVTLLAPWIGYPSKNMGQVKFFGLEEGMPAQIPTKENSKQTKLVQNKKQEYCIPTRTMIIVGVSAGIVLILLATLLYARYQR